MTNRLRSPRAAAAPCAIFLTLVLAVTAIPAMAKDPPDSLTSIQAALPDSISLANKVVYVDFWASWCGPCHQSFPWMKRMYRSHHDQGLEIIAVNVDKHRDAALQFLEDRLPGFPIVYDSTGSLAKLYDLKAMPSSFLYDRDGHLVSIQKGFTDEDIYDRSAEIEHLLKKEKSQ